jgi:hypothetical protein
MVCSYPPPSYHHLLNPGPLPPGTPLTTLVDSVDARVIPPEVPLAAAVYTTPEEVHRETHGLCDMIYDAQL